MELRDYIRILRKSWILIVLLTLVGIGAAATVSLIQTPKYSATSKVFVSTQPGGTVSDLAQGNSFTVQRVNTYSDLVSTPIVLLPVIAELGLEISEGQLGETITASAPLNTSIIEIAVTNSDPVLAADIANATSQSLTNVVDQIEKPLEDDAVSPVKLTLVQQATVPPLPVSPNVPLNIALGLLVGLALGVGLAVLREVLDTRIRNERDVEAITDTAIIGGIVYDPKAKDRPLIVHDDPRSPRSESFRTLRTNLQFLDVGRGGHSFVITSSVQSEGKSTTAANLAIALADSGTKVLLVDADLRRPKVDAYMGLEGAVGITDVLIGRAELADVVQPWGRSRLSVLPAGKIPPNPSELLGSATMARLISTLDAQYDVVIFDAPPLLPVTDAAILAKLVGGAIVVVAAGRTHKNQLTGALAALETVGAGVSGLVLTMLPTKGPDAYGYGNYGYGYGYLDDSAETTTTTRKVAKARVRRAGVKL
ncbi:polysaccharide biosynthesis tyrosine autokinase [Salinibacterium sp. ZJ454]|uniref:polysaccharide biosynthesis tyrosine autokinase n=1 Tax=Salinibacterium sp. ZJ454 TaxID=2708339 RepID=UPI00142352EA|nr:polysaccharide biosynthesis tyrosine autokinase [Salinibacterium sp. ZJ454]